MYPHVVLVEGNDPRLIDVGLLSKLHSARSGRGRRRHGGGLPRPRLSPRPAGSAEVLPAVAAQLADMRAAM
jgi:hypothetical protein